MIEVIGYIASFGVGLVLGLIGGGGSVLCIPILVYLFSIEVVESTAYALFIVGMTSMTGSLQRIKHHMIDLHVGLVFGVPSIITKFIARKWIVPQIPEVILQTGQFVVTERLFILGLFSILAILAAIAMIVKRQQTVGYTGQYTDRWLVIQGAIIGLITGITGLGGGFLIVPTLVYFANMPFKKAVGTGLLIIAMNSLIGFTGDLFHTDIAWTFLAAITGIAILGILTGNLFSKRIPAHHLRKMLGWALLCIGLFILIKETILVRY